MDRVCDRPAAAPLGDVGHRQHALIGTRPAGAVSIVGREVRKPDGLRLHLGGAPGVAGGHQRDAIMAAVVVKLPAVVQHNGGMTGAGVHRRYGFVLSE